MGTLLHMAPALHNTPNYYFTGTSISPPFFPRRAHQPSKKTHSSSFTPSSRVVSFLDLKKSDQSKPEFLDIDLPRHDSSSRYDVVVIGGGPSGLRLAELVSARGVRTCCIDPSPLSVWPNNYGVWVDEFECLGLADCLDKTWPAASVFLDDHNTKHLDRPYARVGRRALKTRLTEACVSHGVRFHEAKAWTVDHHRPEELKSTVYCSDGRDVTGSLVVDASGFASAFVEYDKPRNHGYQIAHGILAEVDHHPFDLDRMVLMDWRDSHMGCEPYLRAGNDRVPTFLYAMPLDSHLVFLEETSLVSRPILSYKEIKSRMAARLRHLGIKVSRVIEEEKCLIPMGGPLPRMPQSVMGAGGAAGLVHPSTGYMVARALALAPVLAEAIVECMGSTRMIRGRPLHRKLWSSVWTAERRSAREFYCFGMETLLRLDLRGMRRFFDAFFDLEPRYWHGFLSSRLLPGELAMLCLSLFGHASSPSKLDIVTKCPLPLARMVGNLALEYI